jgi:hypothetical protein
MQPQTYRLSLFVLILSLVVSFTFDVHGQLFRRWRSQPTQAYETCVECQNLPPVSQPVSQPVYQPVYQPVSAPAAPATPPQISVKLSAPDFESAQGEFEEVRSDFHKAVLNAAKTSLRKGEITRLQMITFRGAMLMPAFRETAEKMATVQIVMSGEVSEAVEFDELGNVSRIDWEGLALFLEKILPLLLQLLPLFL